MFCEHCQKEVVFYGISMGAATGDEIKKYRQQMEQEGKWVLFNPPPRGPYRCPGCHQLLADTAPTRKPIGADSS